MMADESYGQQYPENSTSEHNANTFFLQQYLANNVGTSKPVKVMAVDDGSKTVTVQIMVKQIDGSGNVTDHGKIFDVPFVMLQGGNGAVIDPPKEGQKGLLLCCDRDISAVKSTKDFAPPGSRRSFSAADGVYIGGFMNEDPEQWVKFNDNGMELHDKNGNSLVSGPTGWEFTGPVKFNQVATFVQNVQFGGSIQNVGGGTYSGNIHTTGTVTGDTDVVAGTISGKGHHHGGVTVGGGNTGVPV